MATPLRNYKLIAIAGLKNSGKDTCANMLLYLLNVPKFFQTYWCYNYLKKWPFKNKWKITAFAKPLKQSLSVILNRPIEWFNDRYNKENYYVNLDTLELYPKTDVPDAVKLSENKFQKCIKTGEPLPENNVVSIRQLMQYYGTNVVRKFLGDKTWINATLNAQSNENLIISDLRFKTEMMEIYKRKGTIIYISRSEAKPGSHASEKEVIDLYNANLFDFVIPNEGSLKELFYNIKTLI